MFAAFWSIVMFMFRLQYLGSAPVTKTHGPGSTDDAVKAIVHHVSVGGCFVVIVSQTFHNLGKA